MAYERFSCLCGSYVYYYGPFAGGYSNGQETMASINSQQSGGNHLAGPQIPLAANPPAPAAPGSTQDGGQWLPLYTCTGALVYNLDYKGSISLCTQ